MSDPFDAIVHPEGSWEGDPYGGDSRAGRRSERAERARRRKRRRRNVAALLIVLLVLGGGAFAVVQWGLPTLRELTDREPGQADDYPGPGHGTIEVVIPAGATGTQMGQILAEADVVASPAAFARAFSANPQASGIQPGTYRLLLQMSGSGAVSALLNPESRVQTRVTIQEGLRVEQILERLASVTATSVEEFEAAMEDVEATGLPDEAGGEYEGWLFPATYRFEPGTTPAEMIGQMVAQTVRVLDNRDVPAEDRQELLIRASLIERESPDDDEARTMMARVIENRLDQGWTLDIDAAVAYGQGIFGTAITNEHKESDDPYNLYRQAGLPPTPIASPGESAIDAVLNPADGPWMFWVTVNLHTGETKFSETYAEHQGYVAELRQWERENATAEPEPEDE